MWSGLVLKRCLSLHFTDEFWKPLLPKKFEPLRLHSASGAPFITVALCTCLLHMFSSSTSVFTCPCPSCFCVSSLSHHVLLFYAPGSSALSDFLSCFSWPRQPFSASSNGTGFLCFVILSQKFPRNSYPGNNPLLLLSICVCVCDVNSRGWPS